MVKHSTSQEAKSTGVASVDYFKQAFGELNVPLLLAVNLNRLFAKAFILGRAGKLGVQGDSLLLLLKQR